MKQFKLLILFFVCWAGVMSQANAQCAGFSTSYQATISNNAVTFTSTGTNNTSVNYSWNFDDGTTSTLSNPTHTYTSPGVYWVCLSTFDSLNGCQGSYCDTIIIAGGTSNPCTVQGSFFDSLYNNNSTADFYGYANGGAAPYTYYWNFGDGVTATTYDNGSSGFTVASHTYGLSGTYTVTMIVQDSLGCLDTVQNTITVTGGVPCSHINSSFTSTNISSNLFLFNGTSSGGIAPYTYSWDFGDGTFGTGQNAQHTYNNQSGNYTVIFYSTDASGCTDSVHNTITVTGTNNPCNVQGSFFDSLYNNSTADFYGYANGGTAPYAYYWSFGDGSGTTTYDQNPNFPGSTVANHTYANAGTYTVEMVVYDSLGCGDTIQQTITIGNSTPCSLAVSFFDSLMNGNSVTFQGSAMNGRPNTQYDYFWNFGDGNTSNTYASYFASDITTHTYANPGVYTVCLTVFDSLSQCQVTYCDTIVVNGGTPANCTQNEVFLTLQLDRFAYETSWDITDNAGNVLYASSSYSGMNSNLVTETLCLPTGCFDFNIYDSYGDGICCLYGQGHYTLTDATGQILASGGAFNYQETNTICVGGATNPCSNFAAAITSTGNNNIISFIATSTGGNGVVAWNWNFGDGNVSTSQNPVHTYTAVPANGYYNVCVTVTDSLGCTTTTCDSIFVQPMPCAQNAVTLTLNLDNFASETSWTLTNATGAVVYSGNNYTANGSTVIENFCLPTGCYDFNIYDSWGDGICCAWGQGSYMLTDTNGSVLASGGAFASSETTNICVGGATNPCGNFYADFTYSVNPNGTAQFASNVAGGSAPYTFQWNFNNGTSTVSNPSNNYGGNGAYYAGMTVTDANGCTYTYWDTILITNNNTNPCASAMLSLDIRQDSLNPFSIFMQPIITNAPQNSQYDFSWSFGDGTGAMSGFPTHQYNNYGTYIVCVVAVDSLNGCALTLCDTITIDSSGNFSRTPNYKDVKPSFTVNTQQPIVTYITSTAKVEAVQNIQLYPNPATSDLTIDLESTIQEEVQLTVLNMQGQIVLERINTIENGQNLMMIPVANLASGAYIVRLVGNQTEETLQFVKK